MSNPPPAATPGAALSFSLLGFPVRVRFEFFIIAAILGSSGTGSSAVQIASWVCVVAISVLFHELGHALVARRYGYRPWIELYGMGGLTHMERGEGTRPPTWTSDLAVALAGPLFGLALGAAVWIAARSLPVLGQREVTRDIVRDLLWANVGWSVLNLLPILPYDGGLAVKAVLGRLFPSRGTRMAHGLTLIVGTSALAASVYFSSLWGAYLAARALMGSWRALRFDGSLDRAWARWDSLDFAGARLDAMRAAGRAQDTIGRARAIELVVFTCLATRDAPGAKSAYDAYPQGALPSPLLRAIVALDTGDHAMAANLFGEVPPALTTRVLVPLLLSWGTSGWEDRAMTWLDEVTFAALPREVTGALGEALLRHGCFRLSERVHELRFGATRSPSDAYDVARSLAKVGRVEAALAWLERALDAGWTDLAAMDGDDDLRAVRTLAGYAGLRRRMTDAT
jgi:Zn-dependent protease